MWCARCKNELHECTCPDIEERIRGLQAPGSHVYIPNCPNCSKPAPLCKCGYMAYHAACVEECVKLIGEPARVFFQTECTFVDQFKEHETPEEVAQGEADAME